MTNLPSRTSYVVTAYDRSGVIDGQSATGSGALRNVVRRMFTERFADRVEVGRVAGGRIIDQRSYRDLDEVDGF